MSRFRCPVVLLLFIAMAHVAWAEQEVKIVPDVIYGHKFGLAMTFDVFKPAEGANGAGVLFMVSGGWYSRWAPPEARVGSFKPLITAAAPSFRFRKRSMTCAAPCDSSD